MHRAVTAALACGTLIVACVLALAGCGGDDDDKSSGDDTGDDTGAAGDDKGAAGSGCAKHGATFTEVYDLIFPRATNAHCSMCHGLPPNEISNGNFSVGMDRASTYTALVGEMSPATARCPSMPLVVACKPDESLLVQKLVDPPPCGDRMPIGGMALSADQVDAIKSWIAAGAKDD